MSELLQVLRTGKLLIEMLEHAYGEFECPRNNIGRECRVFIARNVLDVHVSLDVYFVAIFPELVKLALYATVKAFKNVVLLHHLNDFVKQLDRLVCYCLSIFFRNIRHALLGEILRTVDDLPERRFHDRASLDDPSEALNLQSASAFRTRLSPTLKSPMNLQTILSIFAAISYCSRYCPVSPRRDKVYHTMARRSADRVRFALRRRLANPASAHGFEQGTYRQVYGPDIHFGDLRAPTSTAAQEPDCRGRALRREGECRIEDKKSGMGKLALPAEDQQSDLEGGVGDRPNALAAMLLGNPQIIGPVVKRNMPVTEKLPFFENHPRCRILSSGAGSDLCSQ
jgi:hypothetical protein